MRRKTIQSTVLTTDEEAMAVAFRRHMLLPLNVCQFAMKASIAHLTRSALTAVGRATPLGDCQT